MKALSANVIMIRLAVLVVVLITMNGAFVVG